MVFRLIHLLAGSTLNHRDFSPKLLLLTPQRENSGGGLLKTVVCGGSYTTRKKSTDTHARLRNITNFPSFFHCGSAKVVLQGARTHTLAVIGGKWVKHVAAFSHHRVGKFLRESFFSFELFCFFFETGTIEENGKIRQFSTL